MGRTILPVRIIPFWGLASTQIFLLGEPLGRPQMTVYENGATVQVMEWFSGTDLPRRTETRDRQGNAPGFLADHQHDRIGRQVALMSIYLTANARLPMVAGWDNLLPAWFTRLHPKYKTPVNSILFVGAFALGFGLLGIVGVGMQEAFQLLDNAAGIFYALTYMVLFAIPIFAARRIGLRAPLWLRVASASGFLVSLLYIVLTVFPIVEVVSPLAFAAKLVAVTVVFNLAGAALFYWGRRRRQAA